MRRQEQLGSYLGERQVGGQQRQQAKLGRGERRRPGGAGPRWLASWARSAWASPTRVPRPGRRLSRSSISRNESSGTRDVGEHEVGAGKLDPGLHGEVGSA